MLRSLLILISFIGISISSSAQVTGSPVSYQDGSQKLEGYLASNNDGRKKPLVIVVHEWKGLNDYVKMRCDKLAESGYVAFAADIFGKGIRPVTMEDAAKEAGKYKSDRNLTRRRMKAALDVARTLKDVDTTRIVVIGYCFGGMCALELARSGADILGTVSFHGTLSNPTPADAAKIRSKVLICHGALDPNVPEKEVKEFQLEMNQAGKDYQFISYSNAVHAFTNPAAGNDPSKGAAYNKTADIRSWDHLQLFLKEVFSK